MNRNVNLLDHLPTFVQEYREIKHIMNSENPEFQLLCDESERIKNNQFIQSCDEEGIAKFEKILQIVPSPDDSLEARVSRVLVQWNDVVPYTITTLKRKLDAVCGLNNYEITFKDYILTIVTHLELYSQVEELQNSFDYMIPVNLVVVSKNEVTDSSQINLYAFVGTCSCEVCEIEVPQ